jgi:hypothetical protein
MKHSERVAPFAAVATALLSIFCCLPLTIPAALGLAGFGLWVGQFQLWLILASVVLLGVGLVQLYRRPACDRRNPLTIVVFSVAAAIVIGLALLPQALAGFLADRLP